MQRARDGLRRTGRMTKSIGDLPLKMKSW
jgi:hypothetical protein